MSEAQMALRRANAAAVVCERDILMQRYERVRAQTCRLASRFSPDEQLAQAFPDASPTKWHLAHTTWFFDRFVLAAHDRFHDGVDPHFEFVFNSYYEAIGPRQPRQARSLIVRPTLPEVVAYRARIDAAMKKFLERAPDDVWRAAAPALELGTHHEEQHQELILTDIKPVLYAAAPTSDGPQQRRSVVSSAPAATTWHREQGGLVEIGWDQQAGFAFDNESPRQRVWLEPFEMATRPVSGREYAEFIADNGYATPSLWLSDGWATVQVEQWTAPLYWRRRGDIWCEYSLRDGLVPVDLDAPVSHVSFYEADAYARWAGARLPSEAEWEVVAARHPLAGNFLESGALHPRPTGGSSQFFGDVWEWTGSSYAPYARYRPFDGAFAEYNGKFMCNQMVLRGGSCLTPQEHMRPTYRNFFPPPARWQMSGLRLARWS